MANELRIRRPRPCPSRSCSGVRRAAGFGTAVAIRDDLPGEPLGIRVPSRCLRESSLDGEVPSPRRGPCRSRR